MSRPSEVSVYMPNDRRKKVKLLAAQKDQSMSAWINDLIARELQQLEQSA
jgi:hypothetical protein